MAATTTRMQAPRLSRGGARRRRMFTPGELETLVLHMLQSGPRHGYGLMAEIEHRSDSAYAPSPGVLYPALHKLLGEGAISIVSPPQIRQRVYAMTAEGGARLEACRAICERVLEKLATARPAAPTRGGTQIRSALKRLQDAIASGGDTLPPALEAQIAAKIDDLALLVRRRSPSRREVQP